MSLENQNIIKKRGEYMLQKDYSKLKGKITEKGFTQQAVAASIGISESTFSLKLANKALFRQSEIDRIISLLGLPVERVGEYFFTQKV